MTIYRVSPNGKDVNSGRGTQPFATVNKAIDAAILGDEIVIEPGVYSEFVYVTQSGITIRGSDPDNRPIFDGTNVDWGANEEWNYRQLWDVGVGNVTIKDIVIRNCYGILHARGMKVGGDSSNWVEDHVTIKNVLIHDINSNGFVAEYQDGLLVDSCEIHHTVMNNVDLWTDREFTWHGGALGLMPCKNATVNNCDVWHAWGECITADFSSENIKITNNRTRHHISAGIYIGHTQGAEISGNLLWQTADGGITNEWYAYGIGLTDENYVQYNPSRVYTPTQNVDVFNNIIINCIGAHGFESSSATFQTSEGTMQNIKVYHNHFINCLVGAKIYRYSGSDFSGCEFKNNLVYSGSGQTMADVDSGVLTSEFHFDYNSWTDTPTLPAGHGTNKQVGNQALANAEAAITGLGAGAVGLLNYKLTIDSTGPIDNGATGLTLNGNGSLLVDAFGLERGTSNIDIGGNEFNGDVVIVDPQPTITTAQDAGVLWLDGEHVDNIVYDAERGRYYPGGTAHTKLNLLGAHHTPANGGVSVSVTFDAGSHTDGQEHRVFEVYAWNPNTETSSLFEISQTTTDNQLRFRVMVEDTAADILVTNSSTSRQTLGMTWGDAGNLIAYVDGSSAGTPIAYPTTWVAPSPYFTHVGMGGQAYPVKAQISDLVYVRGETPSAGDMSSLHTNTAADTLTDVVLDGLFSAWSWYGLKDDAELDRTDPTEPVCSFTGTPLSGATPLTVDFDWSSCTQPADDPLDYYLFVPVPGDESQNVQQTGTTHQHIYSTPGSYSPGLFMYLESGTFYVDLKNNYIYAYAEVTPGTIPVTDNVQAILDRCTLLEDAAAAMKTLMGA